jgi:uncharacterized protein
MPDQVRIVDVINGPQAAASVFVLPLAGPYLVYAPLHHLAAVVDGRAVRQLQAWLLRGARPSQVLDDLVWALEGPPEPVPRPRDGELLPAFLGLIPTRGCNLACRYCGFQALSGSEERMDPALARAAAEWYVDQVARAGQQVAEVHFFGGEPFCAPEVIDVAYHSARLAAARAGVTIRFEVATNGTFDVRRCQWAAESLDSIVLSLDGPAAIHDGQRPRAGGRGSFDAVWQSAQILSSGTAELSIRSCVTADTVAHLPDIAAWLCHDLRPASVCLEPVQPSPLSEAAGLLPPDPWEFARQYVLAAAILEAHGVEPVYAPADVRTRRGSLCPVGQDVVIVSPDGTLAACYLLRHEWEARRLDLVLGRLTPQLICLDDERVAAVRRLGVWSRPLCTHCFCRWHCAGGCHVHHVTSDVPGDYDRLCIQARLIAARNLLHLLERDDLVRPLFEERGALERLACQPSDAVTAVQVSA